MGIGCRLRTLRIWGFGRAMEIAVMLLQQAWRQRVKGRGGHSERGKKKKKKKKKGKKEKDAISKGPCRNPRALTVF
jgi:hypothetical protein